MTDLISAFLSTFNHELRTPLTAILGFSELIHDAEIGTIDPRYRGYARNINASGWRLLNLLIDIQDLALIEAGLLVLTAEQIMVADMLDECRCQMLDQATASGIEIVIEVPAHLPPVQVDPIRFRQILLNLLSNAVKFSPAGGKVTVDAAVRPDGNIELSVTDTGIGMAHHEIPVALTPFQQVDGSWSRRYQGLGIGLPLAKRLLELHGGELQIASEPGAGTTMTIVLPRLNADPTTSKPLTVETHCENYPGPVDIQRHERDSPLVRNRIQDWQTEGDSRGSGYSDRWAMGADCAALSWKAG
jgi:signal transduction histidine kinase